MAKVWQPCQACGGKGRVPRPLDDPLIASPYNKGILQTYAEKLCDACQGNCKVMVEVDIVETQRQSDPSGD
jgi:hypothetical protein